MHRSGDLDLPMPRARRFSPVGAGLLVVLALTACARSETEAKWGLVSVDGTTLTIEVLVGDSSCHSLGSVTTDESDDRVTISAMVMEQRTIGRGCDADSGTEFVEVVLEEPLGTRVLQGCDPVGSDYDGYFPEQADGGCRAIVADS